jgi:hypothetical protein
MPTMRGSGHTACMTGTIKDLPGNSPPSANEAVRFDRKHALPSSIAYSTLEKKHDPSAKALQHCAEIPH